MSLLRPPVWGLEQRVVTPTTQPVMVHLRSKLQTIRAHLSGAQSGLHPPRWQVPGLELGEFNPDRLHTDPGRGQRLEGL